MSKKTELKLNIAVVLFSQILMLIANFFTKQAILLHLSAEYMGLQTVCANLCDMLAMTYSASGIVMLFRLYKPLEDGDKARIAAVFAYFKTVYRNLARFSLIAGCFLAMITVLCVSISVSTWMVIFYFWLYLAGVLSYNVFLYNYYFLMADQKRYLAAGVCGIVDAVALVFEIIALIVTKNYSLFLALIVAKNFTENAVIARIRKKQYKYLSDASDELIDEEERRGIKKNIYDMIISKIGTLLLYNTDSILISAMVSTAISGYYSCYYFIVYGLQFTITTVFDTLVPKIGRLSVRDGRLSQYRNYIIVSGVNILCTTVCVSGFYLVCKDFITLWVGESSLLGDKLLIVIAINLYLSMTRYTSSTFRQAEGLFNKISWLILFRGIINIFISIIMGQKYGFLGIVAATSISDGLTVFWYEPYMMHKYYRKKMYFALIYELLAIGTILLSIFTGSKLLAIIPELSWFWVAVEIALVIAVSFIWSAIILGAIYLIYSKNTTKFDAILDSCTFYESEEDFKTPADNENKHLKFSFIIPVFNGENSAATAVESVLSEKDVDLELIIVDDGSTDNTYEVLTKAIQGDQRARIIHTENQGQGLARNVGIENATGDYIAFVDADDQLIWDGMRKLTKLANEKQWDVLCGNYIQKYAMRKKDGIRSIESGVIFHGRNDIYERIKTRSAFGYCWNKLFRAEFLRTNELIFDDIRKVYMEDTLFNLKVFACNPTYYFCDIPVYQYNITSNSTSRRIDPEISQKYANLLAIYGKYLEDRGLFEKNNDLLVPLSMRTFCWAQLKMTQLKEDTLHTVLENIQCFVNEKYFNRIISNKDSLQEINRIPMTDERIMFKFCFWLLHHEMYFGLAMFFGFFSPLFKAYYFLIKQN